MFNFRNDYKKSYSQCGEDMIVDYIFFWLKLQTPSYLDIGANDPIHLNNTYFLYKKGCKGVNIEPDPSSYHRLTRERPRDVNLNIGVAVDEGTIDFYIMTSRTLNTFSKETAKRYSSYSNQKIEKVLKIDVINVNEIIKANFKTHPNFVSLDVEGLDMEILKSFDFEVYRPEVFCIETITYTEDNTEEKLNEIIEYMKSVDYLVYADTYINTIFVEKRTWDNRK